MITHAFELSKGISTHSLKAPKVQYPVVYALSKDGRTHHVIGTMHCIPLCTMPDFVIDVVKQSNILLSEFITLTDETKHILVQNKNYYTDAAYEKNNCFIHLIEDDLKQPFANDIYPILDLLDIPVTDHFSVLLKAQGFQSISHNR